MADQTADQKVIQFPHDRLGKDWVIVCKHLLAKPQQVWHDITNEDGVTEGYLCTHCDLKGPQQVPINTLDPIAIKSAQMLRGLRQ